VSKSFLQIYEQNIQGIKWKSDEILDFFYPYFPHLVCISEHHLNQYEIVPFHTGKYTLGANYCRHLLILWGPMSSSTRHVILRCFLSFSRSSCHLLRAVWTPWRL